MSIYIVINIVYRYDGIQGAMEYQIYLFKLLIFRSYISIKNEFYKNVIIKNHKNSYKLCKRYLKFNNRRLVKSLRIVVTVERTIRKQPSRPFLWNLYSLLFSTAIFVPEMELHSYISYLHCHLMHIRAICANCASRIMLPCIILIKIIQNIFNRI